MKADARYQNVYLKEGDSIDSFEAWKWLFAIAGSYTSHPGS